MSSNVVGIALALILGAFSYFAWDTFQTRQASVCSVSSRPLHSGSFVLADVNGGSPTKPKRPSRDASARGSRGDPRQREPDQAPPRGGAINSPGRRVRGPKRPQPHHRPQRSFSQPAPTQQHPRVGSRIRSAQRTSISSNRHPSLPSTPSLFRSRDALARGFFPPIPPLRHAHPAAPPQSKRPHAHSPSRAHKQAVPRRSATREPDQAPSRGGAINSPGWSVAQPGVGKAITRSFSTDSGTARNRSQHLACCGRRPLAPMTRAAVENVPGTPGAEAALSRREREGGCGAVPKWSSRFWAIVERKRASTKPLTRQKSRSSRISQVNCYSSVTRNRASAT
jgi:hypothetical protein